MNTFARHTNTNSILFLLWHSMWYMKAQTDTVSSNLQVFLICVNNSLKMPLMPTTKCKYLNNISRQMHLLSQLTNQLQYNKRRYHHVVLFDLMDSFKLHNIDAWDQWNQWQAWLVRPYCPDLIINKFLEWPSNYSNTILSDRRMKCGIAKVTQQIYNKICVAVTK